MNANFNFPRRIASAILLGVILTGCASGPTAPPVDLLQRIESASTKGDHEALAAYYDREASTARARASAVATTPTLLPVASMSWMLGMSMPSLMRGPPFSGASFVGRLTMSRSPLFERLHPPIL